jgi:hypothetical protein
MVNDSPERSLSSWSLEQEIGSVCDEATLTALEPSDPHDVHALEDSAFLLIVAGQPGQLSA